MSALSSAASNAAITTHCASLNSSARAKCAAHYQAPIFLVSWSLLYRHNKDHLIFNSSVIFIFYFIWKKESTLVFLSLRFNAFMQFLKRWIINYLKNYVFTFSKICIKIQKHFWQTHWQCDATGRPSETLAMICTLDTLQRRYHRTALRWADRP